MALLLVWSVLCVVRCSLFVVRCWLLRVVLLGVGYVLFFFLCFVTCSLLLLCVFFLKKCVACYVLFVVVCELLCVDVWLLLGCCLVVFFF